MNLSCRDCTNARRHQGRVVTACAIGLQLVPDMAIANVHEAVQFCEEMTVEDEPP
jgi:hypothetical protein